MQFVDVGVGFSTRDSTSLNVYNALAVGFGWFYTGENIDFRGEHLTLHHEMVLGYAYHTNSSSALLRNSLLIEIAYGSHYAGALTKIQTVEMDDESAQFQTVGGGAHYLRLNSPWRGLGTTNFDATLRQDLAALTTYAPTLLTGPRTSNQTLLLVMSRDVASLGYHYPAIDYRAANLTLQNSALTLRGGVVVAGTFNLFDHVNLAQDTTTGNYNAYIGMPNWLTADTHRALYTTILYTNGPLGRFYLNGALENQGNRTASAAGLYHFTTRANQTPEAGSVVDRAFITRPS